jgi:hypothetical protein
MDLGYLVRIDVSVEIKFRRWITLLGSLSIDDNVDGKPWDCRQPCHDL